MFTTIDNSPQWVVGIISTTDRTKFRCNITTTRNANYLRNFITRYIQRGNTIISDGWNGYMWLNNANTGYNHISFIHGQGNWGYGNTSTSHIESVWAYLKKSIKTMYHNMPTKGFYYFIKEAEFRFLMKNKTNSQLLNKIKKIIRFCYDELEFDFNDIDYLNSLY